LAVHFKKKKKSEKKNFFFEVCEFAKIEKKKERKKIVAKEFVSEVRK
jgi:hypothetical protein